MVRTMVDELLTARAACAGIQRRLALLQYHICSWYQRRLLSIVATFNGCRPALRLGQGTRPRLLLFVSPATSRSNYVIFNV